MTVTANAIYKMNRKELAQRILAHPAHVFPQTGLSKWSKDDLVSVYAGLVGVDLWAEEL